MENERNNRDWIGSVLITVLIAIPSVMAYQSFGVQTAKFTVVSMSGPDVSRLVTVKMENEDRYGVKRKCTQTVKVEVTAADHTALISPVLDGCKSDRQ
ncbi:hypothetical protein UNDKW_5950 (plasmid) [Undibacterium sp. KW1]|nr:hypothetical protein UNDKW_5950 [Undibacterium sp. KW1]